MSVSIVERRRRDGSVAVTVQIRIRQKGRVIHSEVETFERRNLAEAWATKRSSILAKPGALDRLQLTDPPLCEVIDTYTGSMRKTMGKTKAQVLGTLKETKLAKKRCSEIGSTDLLALANELAARGAQPQTVGNYMSHLASIFKIAKPAWGYPLDYQAMQDAREVAKHQGVTARSNQRDRRPTLDELGSLLAHFRRREQDPRVTPMSLITMFAIFSTRRQEEITRIQTSDLNEATSEIMVRDLKHPGEKIGNNVMTQLPPEALRIIKLRLANPRVQHTGRLFPYSSDAISRAFTDACTLLGIKDLHFHDLRHDGISRLFEMGWNIPNVAMVSAHRTWTSLKRYTHIRQAGDKYEKFDWLPQE